MLRLRSFRSLVRMQAQAVQGASARPLDFSVGSTLRAWIEASAGVGLWVQWQVLVVLRHARAATSRGAALDSWMADYGLARLPAAAATGQVILSRDAAGQAAFVPEGAALKTADGARVFVVTADPADPLWQDNPRGYAVPADAYAALVPVRSASAGVSGNVQAGTITLLTTPLAGLDAATNPVALTNGADAEPDDAFRARFQDYLQSLSKATAGAVAYAVATVQQGLAFSVAEGVDTAGGPRRGHFVVTVDDGTGAPSDDLLGRVQAAVDKVRGLGITFAVQPPAVAFATVSMVLTVAVGADKQAAQGRVSRAITAYIQGLPVGAALPYGRLYSVAYAADPTVTKVSNLLLNGGTADLGGAAGVAVRVLSVAID